MSLFWVRVQEVQFSRQEANGSLNRIWTVCLSTTSDVSVPSFVRPYEQKLKQLSAALLCLSDRRQRGARVEVYGRLKPPVRL